MWDPYRLTMEFTTPLCGGVPQSADLITNWVEQRKATDADFTRRLNDEDEGELRSLGEIVKDTIADLPQEENPIDRLHVGFLKDQSGLYVRGGSLRAHLKSCAQALGPGMREGLFPEHTKISNFAAKIKDSLYIREEKIYLMGLTIKDKADGYRDATISVMTARGPRTCFKRIDWCFPVILTCTLLFLNGLSSIKIEHIRSCLEYGCVQGFNQDRSLQYGRYIWKLEAC